MCLLQSTITLGQMCDSGTHILNHSEQVVLILLKDLSD